MGQDTNQLLEYTIDTLLKAFNPERKPIMKKAHFFKMMDILDTRLQKQKIDINYPKYWYKYGSVAHVAVLSQTIPNGFNRYCQEDNILVPYPCSKSYDIEVDKKIVIDSTIRFLCQEYQYKEDYGRLLKDASYKLNSPHKFNTMFQKYLESVESLKQVRPSTLFKDREIEPLLNILLAEFPEEKYPELLDIHLAWDDTVRLIIRHINDSKVKYNYLSQLNDLFWTTYSKAIRIDYNQHIPRNEIKKWEQEYSKSIVPSLVSIEEIRRKIIMDNDFNINTDDKLVKDTLQIAYHL